MKITYWDEDFFEERTVRVVENLGGLKKGIKLYLFSKNIAEKLRKQFQTESYDFGKAVKMEIKEKEYILFSPKLKPIFDKIRMDSCGDSIKSKEWLTLFCDFVIPVAYGETHINTQKSKFIHSWVIESSCLLWDDTEKLVKKELWKLCYGEARPFEEFVLSEQDQIVKELHKYPELKAVSYPIPYHEDETLNVLLSYRGKVSGKLLGHVLRVFYKSNTAGLSTEMLHKAFDSILQEHLMYKEEQEALIRFPDELIIYRGTDAKESELRPSWSLSKELVLNSYAVGKQLFTAKINKEKVIAYWEDEEEIIVWVDKTELI